MSANKMQTMGNTTSAPPHELAEANKLPLAEPSRRSKAGPPRWKQSGPSQLTPDVASSDELLVFRIALMEALGTTDENFGESLMNQVASSVLGANRTMAEKVNIALAALHGIKPRDELEGMLCVQMVGVHNLAMKFLRSAAQGQQIPGGTDSNVNRAARLLRTFALQVEALGRYRGKGQQKVTVEHVHVHHGGQAIVGAVSRTGPSRQI